MKKLTVLIAFFLTLLGFSVKSQEVISDLDLARDIQKLLLSNGFAVNTKIPRIIYYIGKPPHFKDNWAGAFMVGSDRIEVRLTGNKKEDMNTFFHELYHWFILDHDLKDFEKRAEKFAKLMGKTYEGKLTKGLWDIWYKHVEEKH